MKIYCNFAIESIPFCRKKEREFDDERASALQLNKLTDIQNHD